MIVVDVDYTIDVVADPCQGSRWSLFTAPRPAQRCYLAQAFMPVASLVHRLGTDWRLDGHVLRFRHARRAGRVARRRRQNDQLELTLPIDRETSIQTRKNQILVDNKLITVQLEPNERVMAA